MNHEFFVMFKSYICEKPSCAFGPFSEDIFARSFIASDLELNKLSAESVGVHPGNPVIENMKTVLPGVGEWSIEELYKPVGHAVKGHISIW